MNKKILSLLLAIVMVVSMLPASVLAVQPVAAPETSQESASLKNYNDAQPHSLAGPMTLGGPSAPAEETETDDALIQAVTGDDLSKLEAQTDRAQVAEFEQYAPDQTVTFIVVTEDAPLLEKFSVSEIAAQTASVNAHKGTQETTLNAVKAQTKNLLGSDMKLGYTYTVGTTGFAVETAYGNKAKLESMKGVKSVYVSPTFALPQDMGEQELSPLTGNSSTMIGADVLNASGYTGKGMRIAILDTGILESHPSFQPMDESKLVDPMTREGVEEIWNTLNAAQQTTRLNVSYKSNKIPFAYNYANPGEPFDVSNTFAGSDHGTHVAGISAANAVEGSTVIGMAPDAQLIVMQVFNAGGGAEWATIMAALEDCVRLEVDTANLSLGSAAGFTDPADAMLETMNLFLESDIQVLIASGNDTNNAYMNLWGGDMSLITNPDTGLTGTPATYSSAMNVASANNNGEQMLYFTVDGTDHGFSDTAATAETSFIQNFMNKTLEYVMVPGIGAAEDYEGIDVTGKIAVISRGTTSFPEKQAMAQEKGAIGCVIYNNQSGSFLMQINDGEGNIPAVSVSQSTGKALASAAVKTLTVCNADTKQFTVDTTMSSFSSWGVTPDLKLKPEITGVGGNIYSTRDPSIAGSYYGYMSGTSMATPQVTGAMAVLLQYIEETFPELTGTEQRIAAANLMMSTASPVIHANGLEYSPRNQGAGLVDLVNATTAEAYLSNPAASETRPKAELGDDDARNGVYTFTFELTNLADSERTFDISSSLLTETIVSDWFIGNEPYALTSKVTVIGEGEENVLCYDFNDDGVITTADARIILQVVYGKLLMDEQNPHYAYLDVNADGTVDAADAKVITDYCAELPVNVDLTAMTGSVSTITVPAGETVSVNAEIRLNDTDKAYLEQFPNGIYVEGFLYATEVGLDAENGAAARLTMPILGYYGDWSDPDVFDRDDLGSYSLYPNLVYTYYSEVGYNPYFRNGRSGEEYNYLSYANPLDVWYFGQLRNARKMAFTVTDKLTGEVYNTLEVEYLIKTHFNTSYGMIIPTYLEAYYGELWDGKTATGGSLPDGTTVIYKAEAWLDDGDDIADDAMTFQLTLDNTSPEILNASSLQESLVFEGERTYLTLELLENEKLAAVIFQNPNGAIMGKYELENVPGETLTYTFDITGFGNSFSIIAADFACNETEIDAFLNLGEQNNARPEAQPLSSDLLYGCETFDSAAVEPGWFSASKVDFSGYRNETFDSSNRYYSGEYVNGYIVAQNANTGHIELITPSGTYWATQVLAENNGAIGDPNVWVLYDMALDHSGTLAASYGVNYSTDATDALLAVGWLYMGDNDNDGHDDGYNALFNIKFTNYGTVEVQTIGRIAGVSGGSDLLTLGITTEGEIYGIGTDGVLYRVAKEVEWSDSVYDYVVTCTEIAPTDFINYPNYAGANVIQSMGYDHNTGKMYWYAHTQVPVSYYYENVNVTYILDLETGACEEVGTYGPGGLTCLFVPNDLQSDLFELGVQATDLTIAPQTLNLVEGQTRRLNINWKPWNAKPTDVTWATEDDSLVSVDEYGFVTALASGTATVTATAEVMLDGYWEVTDAGDWVWHDPGMGMKTVSATVNIVPSEDALYGFIATNEGDPDNSSIWVTYSDKTPRDISVIGGFDGFWNGGTYYNGYVYATYSTSFIQDDVIYTGTELYKMKVNEGATPAETTLGEPELIGFSENMEITALAFDYNSGRMYCVENKYVGGLGIIDLDTGIVDMLGQPNGDLYGGVYIPALCVTEDGTIVISDAVANLYTMDPDTLTTKMIYQGNGEPSTAFYEAMCYDYNTGSIYWNACDGAGASPLYLVRMPESEWEQANVVDMGDVATKYGTQQTVLFAIPENEPETKQIPVESIEILNGETLTGLEGGSLKLSVATVPARPTVQTKTWTSSDESVVSVDRYGTMTYNGIGTATITVSITNKDEATFGGPFTDSIEITVMEAAGSFVAFLNNDENGSQYYDFWLNGKDYDLRHTSVGESMIATYSLRTGAYYDGYFYAFNDKGQFMRINAKVPSDYRVLGSNYKVTGSDELLYTNYQVTGMAIDYNTGIMYGLTMANDYNFNTWASERHVGELVTIDLDTGAMTTIAEMDFDTPVYALACDANGTLYAAGGTHDYYADTATIYTVDKETGALTPYTTINGGVHTGANYYSNIQYNTQMTYDFGTDRLYIYATSDDNYFSRSSGMFMVQLGDEPVASYLDGISLDFGRGAIKYGDVYLGLLAFIPEAEEVPVGKVNGILMNKTAGRVEVGGTAQIVASVRPSNAADPSLTWTSSDESIATVDENGVVTGVSTGEVVITITSNETGIQGTCVITVVELTGPQSTAYTVSATKDSLIAFNPALPAQTAEVVTTLSGGSTIKAMAAGNGCIYYITDADYAYHLYRYDILTKQSIAMGQLYCFSQPTGLAYDAANNLIYVTAGFYLFQFQVDALDPAGFNYYSNYMLDSDYCTLAGVVSIDGAVYTVGNEYYNAIPQMMKYSDKYLSDRNVILSGFDLSLVDGATDFSYDPASGLFYFTDAGHNIYTMDMDGNVDAVDILGGGIDMNGLAIIPAAE